MNRPIPDFRRTKIKSLFNENEFHVKFFLIQILPSPFLRRKPFKQSNKTMNSVSVFLKLMLIAALVTTGKIEFTNAFINRLMITDGITGEFNPSAVNTSLKRRFLGTNFSVPSPMPGCPTSCGNLAIPFPFGTSSDCHLDESFLINCNESYDPPKLFLKFDSIEVLDISLDGLMKVTSAVANDCYDESGSPINGTISRFNSYRFPISSTLNKFTVIGCDTYALVEGSEEWMQMSAGCVSWCDNVDRIVNGTCSGIGCCQTSIPKGVKDFVVDIRSFRNHTRVKDFNPCGYAFVVEAQGFEFSSLHLKTSWSRNRTTVPIMLDWSVGNDTCQVAQKNLSKYACRAEHSECNDSSYGVGYHCKCLTGFEGNPYLVDGCIDIDECYTSKPCIGTCANFPGGYSCSCPEGFEGDGKKDGYGCLPKYLYDKESEKKGSIMLYIISGLMIPAVGICWIFWRRKEKKLTKLRHKIFQKNGGLMLKEMLPWKKTLQVFTAEELNKATSNYDESRVLSGHEHFGIVYRGVVFHEGTDRMVTIENYGVIDEWQTEDFISKLITFSLINHRNVVKLIGCCLETQVPLLVYEFISVKTLYDYIHDDDLAPSLLWDIRLKIVAETAGVLAYFHSAGAVPIVHGNVNSSIILLQSGFTVKVHGFALTGRNFDKLEIPTHMLGYFDPEYFRFAQLTVESDVYSFGVILAEILTGNEAKIWKSPQGEQCLAEYFVSSVREDNLLRILDRRLPIEDKIEQLTEVAKLAKKCLSHSSVERPTMKEVEMSLKSLL